MAGSAAREPDAIVAIPAAGGALHGEVFRAALCRGVAVVTHGYAEHCGRYRELAAVLGGAGFTVLTWDVRGHGRSPGPRGYVGRFGDYLDDLRAVLGCAAGLAASTLPRLLVGHSHGALIVLAALLAAPPPAVAAAVLSSPFLALRTPLSWPRRLAAQLASALWPRLSLPSGLGAEDLTGDRERQDARRADSLCFPTANARWFTAARAAQRDVIARGPAIRCPTLWLLGGDDPIADPAVSRALAARVPGAEVAEFAGLRHEVFQETARGEVFARLVAFLARLPG